MSQQEADILADRILPKRIVPVAVIEAVEDAVPLASALAAAGLDIIEVTLRTAAALDCIREIRRGVPQMLVGAGTILEIEQLDAAIKTRSEERRVGKECRSRW